jgi:tRNA modification GTPase
VKATGPDTIAAIASPLGPGGVGVIRLSGPEAVAVAAGLVGRSPGQLPDRQMVLATARSPDGERLDDVLVVAMRGPRSYTGEDVAEVHGHGGVVNMRRLLERVLAGGARLAEPGEFTRRAFTNGKLDLTRAEAVIGVIEAASERAARVAQANLSGGVGKAVRGLRDRTIEALAEIEAQIDFPEEGIEHRPAVLLASRIAAAAAAVGELAASFGVGRALCSGAAVALVGPVNAGKSSLFNRLVGQERAVVSSEAGTTRDFVEAQVVWDGIPITLVDTAGKRAAKSEAERRGIALSKQRAAAVDVRVIVRDATAGAAECAPTTGRDLYVLSKVDLVDRWPAGTGLLPTSAADGRGVAELRAAIVAKVVGRSADGDDGPVVTSERQAGLLRAAEQKLRAGADALANAAPLEIVALEVNGAVQALSDVLGERVDEQVLDALFARFCIGK